MKCGSLDVKVDTKEGKMVANRFLS